MPGRNDEGPLLGLLLFVVVALAVVCVWVCLFGAPPGMNGERA